MRRRHQLRPDTFPFLAVLLCAMGSLILILMELDRRARSAAHARAKAAWHKDEQEKAELLARLRARRESERQAETERHRQARETRLAAHQAEVQELRGQEQAVVGERGQVEARINELLRAMRTERDTQTAGEKQREEEARKIEEARRVLISRQEQLEKTKRRAETSQSERTRLTRDLLLIEEALARLKEQKLRERKTWSVVPYVGKRGLNRMPLYIECNRAGLVFQPDKRRFAGNDSSVAAIREEVRRRSKEFAAKLPAGEPNREPYWLLLVRPDGILPYYAFLQAVKPLEVAYGYEFIDPGWDLDFPDPSGQPAPVEIAAPLPSPGPKKFAAGSPPFRGGPPGVTTGRPGIPGSGIPAAGPFEKGPFSGGRSVDAQPSGAGIFGGGTSRTGPPLAGSPGSGQDKEGRPGGNAAATGAPGSGGDGDGPPADGSSAGVPAATLLTPRQETPGLPPLSAGAGQGGEEGGKEGGREGSAASGATPGDPPGAIPSEGSGGAGSPPPDAPTPDREAGMGAKGNNSSGSPMQPLRPAARTGAPEWVLIVDCMPERVRLSPSQLSVPLADLAQGRGGSELLQRTARDLVARRRALQRPGGPPVRIVIRFLVHKDGLRAFHLAYPLLDGIDAEKRAVLSGE